MTPPASSEMLLLGCFCGCLCDVCYPLQCQGKCGYHRSWLHLCLVVACVQIEASPRAQYRLSKFAISQESVACPITTTHLSPPSGPRVRLILFLHWLIITSHLICYSLQGATAATRVHTGCAATEFAPRLSHSANSRLLLKSFKEKAAGRMEGSLMRCSTQARMRQQNLTDMCKASWLFIVSSKPSSRTCT